MDSGRNKSDATRPQRRHLHKKVDKKDGLIDPDGDHELNWRKFRAYHPWPGIYFFTANGTRVKITAAIFENGAFIIKK